MRYWIVRPTCFEPMVICSFVFCICFGLRRGCWATWPPLGHLGDAEGHSTHQIIICDEPRWCFQRARESTAWACGRFVFEHVHSSVVETYISRHLLYIKDVVKSTFCIQLLAQTLMFHVFRFFCLCILGGCFLPFQWMVFLVSAYWIPDLAHMWLHGLLQASHC